MDFSFGFCPPFEFHFGGVLGAQMEPKAIKKPLQKNIKTKMPYMSPSWSQRESQNGVQIIKNEALEAPCFKGGSQEASRALPGSILDRFWDWDLCETIFISLSNLCLVILARILQQYVTNKSVQHHKESSRECSRELPRNFFSLRAILH